MRPVTVTIAAAGNSTPVVLDYNNIAFGVGIGVVITGSPVYTIQHSFDDPYGSYATDYNTNGTWFDHDVADLVNATANQNGSFNAPIRASRVKFVSGTGTVTATFVQGIK